MKHIEINNKFEWKTHYWIYLFYGMFFLVIIIIGPILEDLGIAQHNIDLLLKYYPLLRIVAAITLFSTIIHYNKLGFNSFIKLMLIYSIGIAITIAINYTNLESSEINLQKSLNWIDFFTVSYLLHVKKSKSREEKNNSKE